MVVSGRRLEFERNVWQEVAAPSRLRELPRGRTVVSLATVLCGLVVVGIGLAAAAGAVWFVFGMSDRSAVAQMSTVFLVGIQSNDMKAAIGVCAEGEVGSQAMKEEDAKTFTAGANSSGTNPATDRRARQESLTVLRKQLAELGVNWDDVAPIAFGGVRARVKDSELMTRPVTVATGNLYFASAGRVYAVEVSARKCGSAYYVTDVWDWTSPDVEPALDAVKEYSSQTFEKFATAEDAVPSAAEISQERQLFIKL